jgi:uncharacterized membrane protein YhfC
MNALFLLQGIGMISVGLLAALYWKQRTRVSSVFFLWGGLTFLIAMALKSVAAIPIPQIIIKLRDAAPEFISEPLLWLFVGLLTGVFECGISLVLIYRLRQIRSANWYEAIGYGLGFGATEAVLLGIYSFVLVLLVIIVPHQLPPELVSLLDIETASMMAIPVPILERAITILLHTFSLMLIVYAVQNKDWKWFWIAFIYKVAMDSIAGYIQITYGIHNLTLEGVWLVELVLIPFGLIGLWGLLTFRNRWPTLREGSKKTIDLSHLTQKPADSLEIHSAITTDE